MSSKYRDYIIKSPTKGVFLDLNPADVPLDGWRVMDQFHVRDGRVEKYPGWELFDEDFTTDTTVGEVTTRVPLIWGQDFVIADGTRYFLLATKDDIYYYDRSDGSITSIMEGFSGYSTDRWQSAIMNGRLYLVNRVDNPVEFVNPSSIWNMVDDPLKPADAWCPDGANCIANFFNHLVFGNTLENGVRHPRRIRWSDIDDAKTFISTDANEANVYDFPEEIGEIKGMAVLGPNALIVYGTKAIYSVSYIGRPLIFAVERKITWEGLFAPYSLVAGVDAHFFIGNRDFYMYAGGSTLRAIGESRVATSFFSDFQQDSPDNVYGYVHPNLSEIWWPYISMNSTYHDKMLAYNWEYDSWATREYFPHSMLTEFLMTTVVQIGTVTRLIQDAGMSWRDKQGKGVWVIISGD